MSDVYPESPMGSPASPATPAMTPGHPPEVERRSECPLHGDGQDHVQLNTHGNWMCVIGLRGLDDGWPQMEAERDKLDADCQQLTATLTSLGNSHADLREERDQLQAAHNALSRKNAELAAELDRMTRQCDGLHVQVDQLRRDRDAYRELLNEAGIADTTPAEEG